MPSGRKRVEVIFPRGLYDRFKRRLEEEGWSSVSGKIKHLVIEYLNQSRVETQKREGEAEK